MKKLIVALLALILVVSLTGCNVTPEDGIQNKAAQNNNSQTQENLTPVKETGQKSDASTVEEAKDISRDQAISIALDHAKVAKADATRLSAEKDLDNGTIHFDVEFHAGGYEYDYEIEAATGKILKSQKEKDDDKSASSGSNSTANNTGTTSDVTRDSAKKTALKHAGVAEKDAKHLQVEWDDDGYFEVSFDAGGYEYDYKISAKTGKILKWEKEKDDDVQTAAPSTISKTEAKNVALKHAGVSVANARDLEVELDDDGYYEVTFENSGYEYEYKISAKTGKIIISEKERND